MPITKTEELDKQLRELYAVHSSDTLHIKPILDEQEAEDFLAGFTAELFTVDDLGYAQSAHLDEVRPKKDRQQIFQLFWHGPKLENPSPEARRKRYLFREGVCQLAAVSALVLRYGWPREQVYLDPGKTLSGNLQYAVDLVVTSGATGQTVICGEVKRSTADLQALIRQFSDCCQRGAHGKNECNNSQHRKFEACWQSRPQYFLGCLSGKQANLQPLL